LFYERALKLLAILILEIRLEAASQVIQIFEFGTVCGALLSHVAE